MEKFLAVETLVIGLLFVAALAAIVVRRLRIPYTVALVLVGLPITFNQLIDFNLTPELILAVFVPPLVFEAAFHIEFKTLREQWLPIFGLAVPGVLLTTLIVGAITAFGVGISLTSALVFGALISATDPVAVVALFRQLGAPKRLTVLIESESLLNDGTAIVVFQLVLAAALATATNTGSQFDLLAGGVDFVRVSAGGAGIGLAAGFLVAQIIARVDDYLIETALTTALAFGAYLIAEQFHVSGVLAVVAAGIVTGSVGTRRMSPTTKIVLFNFWEYLAFVANSLVFLLIGLETNLREIFGNLWIIGIAVAAVLASRALVVYGITSLTNLRDKNVPAAYQHVLFWGGLRGAIGLALVLSLPVSFADREVLRAMTFGVVLFTLLGQGTTMNALLKRLKLTAEPAEIELEYERRHARLIAAEAARRRIEEMQRANLISAQTAATMIAEHAGQIEKLRRLQTELLAAHPNLQIEETRDAELESQRARRAALAAMLGSGVIGETVYEELVAEVDRRIENVRQTAAQQEILHETVAPKS